MSRYNDDDEAILETLRYYRAMLRSGEQSPSEVLRNASQGSILTESLEANLGGQGRVLRGRGETPIFRAGGSSQKAEVLTVNLQAGDFQGGTGGVVGRRALVKARLRWGQGGATFRAEVDCRVGTQFSVAASFLQVDAFIEENPVLVADPTIIDSAQVSGAVTTGSRGGRCEAFFTYFPRTIVNGDFVDFAVPAFARTFYGFTPSRLPLDFYAGTNMQVEMLGFAGDAVPFVFARFFGPEILASLANEGLRIPGGANFVRVSNAGGGPPMIAVPTFGLNF